LRPTYPATLSLSNYPHLCVITNQAGTPRVPQSRRSRTSLVSSADSFTAIYDVPSMGDTSTSPEPTTEPRGVGLSDPIQSAYRRRILELSSTVCEPPGRSYRATYHRDVFSFLCRVGADMDLPMIAVIGSQSAGKSSLIESISGITLPRAAGTCTR